MPSLSASAGVILLLLQISHAAVPFPIPSTISSEAQALLEGLGGPAINRSAFNLSDIKAIRKSSDDASAAQNKEAQDMYLAKTEELKLNGVRVLLATPKGYKAANDDKIAVYCFGGGYVLGSPDDSFRNFTPVARLLGERQTEVRADAALGLALQCIHACIAYAIFLCDFPACEFWPVDSCIHDRYTFTRQAARADAGQQQTITTQNCIEVNKSLLIQPSKRIYPVWSL
jgi:hypothetical protein